MHKKIAIYVTNNFSTNSGSTLFFSNLLDCFNNLKNDMYVFSRFPILKKYKNLKIYYLKGKNEKSELQQIYNYDLRFNFYKIFIRNKVILKYLPLYVNKKNFREKLLFWFWLESLNYIKYFRYINRYNICLTNSAINKNNLNYFKNVKIFSPFLYNVVVPKLKKNHNKINIVYFGTFKKEYLIQNLIQIFIKDKLYNYFNIDVFLAYNKRLNYKSPGLSIQYNISHDKLINIFKTKYYDFSFNIRADSFNNAADPSSKLLESIQYLIKPFVNKNLINVELLGENYPYYCSSINDMINIIKNYKNSSFKLDMKKIHPYFKNQSINTLKSIFG